MQSILICVVCFQGLGGGGGGVLPYSRAPLPLYPVTVIQAGSLPRVFFIFIPTHSSLGWILRILFLNVQGLSPLHHCCPSQPVCALHWDSQRRLHSQPTLPYANSLNKLYFLILSKQYLLILGNYKTEKCRKFKNNVYTCDTFVHFLLLLFSFEFRVFSGGWGWSCLAFHFFAKWDQALYSFESGFSHLKYCDNYHIKDF